MKKISFGAILWFSFVVACFAQDSLNVTRVGFYGTVGNTFGVSVSGDYAYVAVLESGLRVVDITNPSVPTEVGFYNTPGAAFRSAVSGDYAYVADHSRGLRILNIANPAAPTEVGFFDTPGYAYDVVLAGHIAYVADEGSGIRLINISNPSAPTSVGYYFTSGSARDLAVEGAYAYVACSQSGLRVINVANPAVPSEVGFFNTPGYAYGVAVSGVYAYVADWDGGLRVISTINPAAPMEVAAFNTPGLARDVTVVGNYAFVADMASGLRVIDITNPAAPVEVGFYDPPGNANASEVKVVGNYAYVAYWGGEAGPPVGVGIYDCSAAIGSSCEADPAVSLIPDNPTFPGSQSVSKCVHIGLGVFTRIEVPVHNSINIPAVTVSAGCASNPECQPAEGWNLALPWQFDENTTSYFTTISRIGDGCCVTLSLDFVLPVELLSFEAVPGDRRVTLHWTTASETDNDYFDIERNGTIMGRMEADNLATGSSYSWSESNLINGREYTYSLISASVTGEREVIATASTTPTMNGATITEYALHQNYPNPFNPETSISFDVVETGEVMLNVYNSIGQTVATLVNGEMSAGRHRVTFDAATLPSGLYFCRLEAGGFNAVRKMVLMK